MICEYTITSYIQTTIDLLTIPSTWYCKVWSAKNIMKNNTNLYPTMTGKFKCLYWMSRYWFQTIRSSAFSIVLTLTVVNKLFVKQCNFIISYFTTGTYNESENFGGYMRIPGNLVLGNFPEYSEDRRNKNLY